MSYHRVKVEYRCKQCSRQFLTSEWSRKHEKKTGHVVRRSVQDNPMLKERNAIYRKAVMMPVYVRIHCIHCKKMFQSKNTAIINRKVCFDCDYKRGGGQDYA